MAEFEKPSLDDWAARAVEELKGRNVGELVLPTPEGIDVKALYTAEDLEGIETLDGRYVATHELALVSRYGKRAVRLDGGSVVEDSLPPGPTA